MIVRQLATDVSARFYAIDDEGRTLGQLDCAIDAGIGYSGNLECHAGAPLRTAAQLIYQAAIWLGTHAVHGVLIKCEGKNVGRVTYRRLGFKYVHGCPDLMSAPLDEVIDESRKRAGQTKVL